MALRVVHTARTALGIAAPEAPLRRRDLPWLFVIIIFGGILGPVLLMLGLRPDICLIRIAAAESSKASQRWASRGWCFMRMLTRHYCWVPWQSSSAQSRWWEGQSLSLDVGAAMISANASVGGDRQQPDPQIVLRPTRCSIAMIKGLAAGTVNMASGFWLGDALHPPPSAHWPPCSANSRDRDQPCSFRAGASSSRDRFAPEPTSHSPRSSARCSR